MKRKKTEPTLQISDARVYAHAPKSYRNYLLHVPFGLRIIALILIILVLARPQTTNSWQNSEIEGIDIMLAIDVSTSMLAEDLKPNRLEAAKDVAAEFINGRPNDNIGITLFAGESFTQCPLTVDHAVLLNLFQGIKCDIIEDGTAVGMGIANAVTRLKDSKAKSKVIILLTDGTNNKGDISPLTAAEIAKVLVYVFILLVWEQMVWLLIRYRLGEQYSILIRRLKLMKNPYSNSRYYGWKLFSCYQQFETERGL